ncbi:hypothetical protein CKC_03395 [Candidatus Liberibacter solanacearum CLso-ZC1]|uniref:Lipoprotein n=1 Tax=Liberibacter solanacearum (strain CLso-ZC1) TaxID=658172 RepID=E4UB37_LIBSC|nr:hypothetical protein [Candidatus Liberibacter solanacearum]ADR52428.1 hypothetical protein CKC_03395 [Candidatus Liberibacter solanacearum CLso-ZC1]
MLRLNVLVVLLSASIISGCVFSANPRVVGVNKPDGIVKTEYQIGPLTKYPSPRELEDVVTDVKDICMSLKYRSIKPLGDKVIKSYGISLFKYQSFVTQNLLFVTPSVAKRSYLCIN